MVMRRCGRPTSAFHSAFHRAFHSAVRFGHAATREADNVHDAGDGLLVHRVVVAEGVLAPSVPRRSDRVGYVGQLAVDHLASVISNSGSVMAITTRYYY